jgi:hypothetical protein
MVGMALCRPSTGAGSRILAASNQIKLVPETGELVSRSDGIHAKHEASPATDVPDFARQASGTWGNSCVNRFSGCLDANNRLDRESMLTR